MQKEETVSVLNDLISISEDGHKGFTQAMEIATDANLKSTFRACAQDCADGTAELHRLIEGFGGKPDEQGSIAGSAHRGWTKLKSSVEDKNIAVLEEVERGQDHAKAAYAKALKQNLDPSVRSVVEHQAAGAVRNHDKVRDLRNAYKAAA